MLDECKTDLSEETPKANNLGRFRIHYRQNYITKNV